MAANKTLVSPSMTSLEQTLASGNTTTLDTFWQEAIEHGTPLIEPIEGDDEHNLVTFLWRDQGRPFQNGGKPSACYESTILLSFPN